MNANVASPPTHLDKISDLARDNLAACASALRDAGQLTVTQLADVTGMSRAGALSQLKRMEDLGLAAEHDAPLPNGAATGRPARWFRFTGTNVVVAGVEFGRRHDRTIVSNLEGSILAVHRVEHEAPVDPAERIAGVIEVLAPWREHLASVGVAITGPVDTVGRVLESPSFRAWEGIDVRALLVEAFSVPVALENDLNLAVIAEGRIGAARDVRSSAYLPIAHQTAISAIIDGRVLRGAHHSAGQMGRLHHRKDAPAAWESSDLIQQAICADSLGVGEPTDRVDEFISEFAQSTAQMVSILDPGVVVLGVNSIDVGEHLSAQLAARVPLWFDIPPVVDFRIGALGEWAAASGALIMGFDIAHTALFGPATRTELPSRMLDGAQSLPSTLSRELGRTPSEAE